MMTRITLILSLATLLAGVAGPAFGQAALISAEDGIEASTDTVSLPSVLPARWSVKPCDTCTRHELTLDERTRFFVGRDEVPLATLRAYAAGTPRQLDIFAEPGTRRVTRVILRAELRPTDRAAPAPQP